ncbi:patatin-like phospholipase family protein [Bosea psychrotolerans]|uniref:Patatin-like phospholipase n=1 Tax=Bosea psychrotolerans TaxID=1871628 RepID=A0A2S4MCI9_9HYPH|nr:patatin-like phospholipase family protein [Bosea psychrotolerans]POR52470.1 patatin-like phospholipase [Bosea psychrotolerans]
MLTHIGVPAAPRTPAKPSDTAVILAFSGGGARSAAFGYGVLSALAEQRSPGMATRTLADDVAVVAGVSGGGVLAAHFALYGPTGLSGFRRDFLDQDPEASLRTSYTPENLLRAYRGGINDLSGFAAWLDDRLYHGATLRDVERRGRARLVLHATDLYNRAPFSFDRKSFLAICSDYDGFSLAHAVAASSAVPVAFTPIVMRNFNDACPVAGHRTSPTRPVVEASLFERHISDSQERYASASDLNYLKLLDGGLVDNLATSNLAGLMKQPAPEPLQPATARQLRRAIIIVVDAATRVGGDISNATEGPMATDTVVAATDAMIDNASRMSFDVLEQEATRWRDRLTHWRCNTRSPQAGCDKFEVKVVRLSLADVQEANEKARIMQLHFKLSLKPGEVDFLAGLGRRLLRGSAVYQRFIRAGG